MISDACYLLSALAALILVIVGYTRIFRAQQVGESDVQATNTKLTGFGYLSIAMFVLVVGSSLCYGGQVAMGLRSGKAW